MSTPSTTNPWEETITWQPAQPVEPGEPWLVCTDDGQVGQAVMEGLDWYWSDDIGLNYPITARVARMARLPIGPPLPFSGNAQDQVLAESERQPEENL